MASEGSRAVFECSVVIELTVQSQPEDRGSGYRQSMVLRWQTRFIVKHDEEADDDACDACASGSYAVRDQDAAGAFTS